MATIPDSFPWVHCKLGDGEPYLLNVERLRAILEPIDYSRLVEAIKERRPILIEDTGMELKAVEMAIFKSSRLAYLIKNFERSVFKLAYLKQNNAVFYREGHLDYYYSMNEMLEHGFNPTETITLTPGNIPVYEKGDLIDVFVPVGESPKYFKKTTPHK